MVDLREIKISDLIGLNIGFFTPMNGGKTRAMVGELERTIHSGFNAVAYNPITNKRDGSFLVVDGRYKFPAIQKENITSIKDDLERRREIIFSKKRRYSGENGKINVMGVMHTKFTPLVAYGVDELNLFCLTEKDTEEVVEFMQWSKRNEFVGLFSGLLHDFRHRKFGYVNLAYDRMDIRQEKKPVCKAVHGKQCGKPAIHTQRLWSLDFAKELGLGDYLDEMEIFDYATKEGEIVCGQYVPAPFFDKTVNVEDTGNGELIYLPVCDSCARVPFKEEVFENYRSFAEGLKPIVEMEGLENEVVKFLLGENWIRKVRDDKGNVIGREAVPFYRNSLGGFSPLE